MPCWFRLSENGITGGRVSMRVQRENVEMVMTGKRGKVMGKTDEVVAETGHVTVELDECGVDVSEWRLATMMRCSKCMGERH